MAAIWVRRPFQRAGTPIESFSRRLLRETLNESSAGLFYSLSFWGQCFNSDLLWLWFFWSIRILLLSFLPLRKHGSLLTLSWFCEGLYIFYVDAIAFTVSAYIIFIAYTAAAHNIKGD